MLAMHSQSWPDSLQPALPQPTDALLERFWVDLSALPDLIQREENLLAARLTARLRQCVLELMLALNGIAWPEGTRHLNTYLSESQKAAIEKTLAAPLVGGESWIGQAVALVVIYRWYAPQLVQKYGIPYPQAAEDATMAQLHMLPNWPIFITTD